MRKERKDKLIQDLNSIQIVMTGIKSGKSFIQQYIDLYKAAVLKIITTFLSDDEWISCNDALPHMKGYPNDIEYLVTLSDGEVTTLYYASYELDDCFYDHTTNDVVEDVIAWQPLPEAYASVEIKE